MSESDPPIDRETILKLIAGNAAKGDGPEKLVVIVADPNSGIGREMIGQLNQPRDKAITIAVPLQGFHMADPQITAAVQGPPPKGSVRLLKFNSHDLWKLDYLPLL